MTMPCTYKDYKGDKQPCGLEINYNKETKTATNADGSPHKHRWEATAQQATIDDVKQQQDKAKQSLFEYNQKFPKTDSNISNNLETKIADLSIRVNDVDSHVIGLLSYIKTLTDASYGADVTDRVTILAEENAQLKIALQQLQKQKGFTNAAGVK